MWRITLAVATAQAERKNNDARYDDDYENQRKASLVVMQAR